MISFGRASVRAAHGPVHERHEAQHRRLRGPAGAHLRLARQHERHPVKRIGQSNKSQHEINRIATKLFHRAPFTARHSFEKKTKKIQSTTESKAE